MKKITYKQSGVDYSAMDPLKRLAQIEGKKTIKNLRSSGYKEDSSSRGESAYVIEDKNSYLAFVEEGLGTKNLVADAMLKITGKTYYDQIAQDAVAAIINDLITVGARPLTVLAYWAVGSTDWFKNKKRLVDLTKGWAKACNLSGATWGGGETPTLSGIVNPDTIDLAGAAFGVIKPKKRLALGKKLHAGDAIVIFGSSGIHANGFTLARKISEELPKGYATKLPSGNSYGEALLKPTVIYAKLIQGTSISTTWQTSPAMAGEKSCAIRKNLPIGSILFHPFQKFFNSSWKMDLSISLKLMATLIWGPASQFLFRKRMLKRP